MLLPMHGVGDSLMCGLQGYDIRPERSFFRHLTAAVGQATEVPSLRWNFTDFSTVIRLAPGEHRLEQAMTLLARRQLELTVESSPHSSKLFAVPGFGVRAAMRYHEQTPVLPIHLRLMTRCFLNPHELVPATLVERALAAGPAGSLVVWLGGVDWVGTLLSAKRRSAVIERRLTRQYERLLPRLLDGYREAGWPAPRLIVGGSVCPTRLPLLRPSRRGDWHVAFKSDRQAKEPCDRISLAEKNELSVAVQRFNRSLRATVEKVGGLFVDLDECYAGAIGRGYEEVQGERIPASMLTGLDLVHPTDTGHAIVANWFAQAIERTFGERLEVDVLGTQERELAAYREPNPRSWRRVMRVIYEEFLYRNATLRPLTTRPCAGERAVA